MKAKACPAIEKFLGWWVVMFDGHTRTVGQIVEVNDLWSLVRCDDGDDQVASTALLDSRIAQIYPSKRAAMKAGVGKTFLAPGATHAG